MAREITAQARRAAIRSCSPSCAAACIFAGQLLPQLRFPLEFDYLDVTRYGAATRRRRDHLEGQPRAPRGRARGARARRYPGRRPHARRHREKLLEAGATEFYSAVFADKDTGRAKPVTADFVGITVPNRYVFGFGMDVYGWWRNLPAIYALKDDDEGRC